MNRKFRRNVALLLSTAMVLTGSHFVMADPVMDDEDISIDNDIEIDSFTNHGKVKVFETSSGVVNRKIWALEYDANASFDINSPVVMLTVSDNKYVPFNETNNCMDLYKYKVSRVSDDDKCRCLIVADYTGDVSDDIIVAFDSKTDDSYGKPVVSNNMSLIGFAPVDIIDSYDVRSEEASLDGIDPDSDIGADIDPDIDDDDTVHANAFIYKGIPYVLTNLDAVNVQKAGAVIDKIVAPEGAADVYIDVYSVDNLMTLDDDSSTGVFNKGNFSAFRYANDDVEFFEGDGINTFCGAVDGYFCAGVWTANGYTGESIDTYNMTAVTLGDYDGTVDFSDICNEGGSKDDSSSSGKDSGSSSSGKDSSSSSSKDSSSSSGKDSSSSSSKDDSSSSDNSSVSVDESYPDAFDIIHADKIKVAIYKPKNIYYTSGSVMPRIRYVKIKLGKKWKRLSVDYDYKVYYKNNVEVWTKKSDGPQPTVIIKGIHDYKGTYEVPFVIRRRPMKKVTLSINKANRAGAITFEELVKLKGDVYKCVVPVKPDMHPFVMMDTVSSNGKIVQVPHYLTKDVDYKIVKYKNNKKAGKATVTVKGLGNYSGTYTAKFNILKHRTLLELMVLDYEKENKRMKWNKESHIDKLFDYLRTRGLRDEVTPLDDEVIEYPRE